MRRALRLALVAAALAAAATCTSRDYILQNGEGGGISGATGSSGEGGFMLSGAGGGVSAGLGGHLGFGGGVEAGVGGSIGTGGAFGGTGGVVVLGVGGAIFSGTGGAAGSDCLQLTDLAGCQARADCHSVFLDPNNCGCPEPGCCAQFNHCADGAQAQCSGQVTCAVETPYCAGPYVLAYRDDCFEGCVDSQACAP